MSPGISYSLVVCVCIRSTKLAIEPAVLGALVGMWDKVFWLSDSILEDLGSMCQRVRGSIAVIDSQISMVCGLGRRRLTRFRKAKGFKFVKDGKAIFLRRVKMLFPPC